MRVIVMRFAMLIAILGLAVSSATAQDDPANQIILLTEADASNFPQITFEARVVQNGRAIGGLTTENFSISEDIEPESLSIEPTGTASNLAIMIDTANSVIGAELDRIKDALRGFFNNPDFYEDGQPVVIVIQRDQQQFVRNLTSRAAILQFINEIQPGSGNNYYEPGLRYTADQLRQIMGENGVGHILVVGVFNRLGADVNDSANLARELNEGSNITVSGIHAFAGSASQRSQYTPMFERIAEAGGGSVAIFGPNSTIQDLTNVYETIRGDVPSYRVSYTVAGVAQGEQGVTITAETPNGPVSGEFFYDAPDLAPPSVTITEPAADSTITRTQPFPGAEFDVTEQSVRFQVSFEDEQRPIQRAELEILVGGQVQDSLTLDSEDFEAGTEAFRWSLLDFSLPEGQESTEENVELRLTVVDAFEISGTTTTTVRVVSQLESASDTNAAESEAPPDGESNESTAAETESVDNTAIETEAVDETGVDVPDEADLNATQTAAFADVGSLSETATFIAANPQGQLSPEDVFATATAFARDGGVPGSAAASTAEADTGDDNNTTLFILLGVSIVSTIFVVILVVVLRRRRRGAGGDPYGNQGYDPAFGGMKTMVGGQAASAGAGPSPGVDAVHAYIEVLGGPSIGKDIPIDVPYFTIGRELKQGINYATPKYDNVSSRHCSIIQRGGSYLIVDHGSTNGTFVNGNQLTPNVEVDLPPQATVQLGKDSLSSLQFRFKPQGASAPAAGKTRIDIGGGGQQHPPGDPGIWSKKTQMYGDAGSSSQQANQQQPQQGSRSAAPGQFFNPGGRPAPPQQQQQNQQQNYGNQGELDSWSNVREDDSWLEDD